jgi:mannose-6-phosphate isomerase-like protein (cupin superfamily)
MKALAVLALVGSPIILAAQTGAPRKPAAAPARTSLEILVTSRVGDPLADVAVTATGSVVRSGRTDEDGVLSFKNVPPGQYRLRMTRDGWISLERDVTVKGPPAMHIEVTMSPAETETAPAPSNPPPPVNPVPATPAPPAANVDPKTVFIPDFIDQNFLGRAPRKESVLACASTSKTTVLQLREPLGEHTHTTGDEHLYIVAGEAMHRVAGKETKIEAGSYSLVPRGVPHSLSRRGTNPIVLLSIETGQSCGGTDR